MPSARGLSADAEIGIVAASARRLIRRAMWPSVAILSAESLWLFGFEKPGAFAFLLIAVATIGTLGVWAKKGEGLPIVPMLILQHLAIYALPIATQNETILQYPATYLTAAGWEVVAFDVALICAWRLGMGLFRTASPLCFALQGMDEKSPKLAHIGLGLLAFGTAYNVVELTTFGERLIASLPTGSTSILHVFIAATSACGCFLAGIMLGRGHLSGGTRMFFWALLVLQCVLSAAGLLLSASATIVFAAAIGLFWGGGKMPWRFVLGAAVAFAFLNLGKFTMRGRYWQMGDDEPVAQLTASDIPQRYVEWIGASWDALTGKPVEVSSRDAFSRIDTAAPEAAENDQSILARINNLQNLLFVMDAMSTKHIAPLDGATYTLIPPLLVPRILWPDKPRSHEGQVLLNVYFGRQDLRSTFQTYIAWGLLPEAYGNFGPITGAILLGVFLGLTFAWVEKFVARKLLLSMEGFLSFTIFVGMANSYEMVASVLVTSLYQACIPIIIACAPFVDRIIPRRTLTTTASDSAENPTTSAAPQ